MAENFANSYQTTLAADLTAAATTLTVASATGAPAPQFRLLIDAEIVIVTAVAGITYTVTRGAEGTVAASHSASTVVSHVVTAGSLAQLRDEAPHVIQDEGVALTAREALNLVGEHVAATDDAAGNRTTITVAVPDATTTAHGLLLAADKSKLDGVASGAQVNVLESVTGTAPIVAGAIAGKSQAVSITAATGSAAGSMSAADKGKLDGVASGAQVNVLEGVTGTAPIVAGAIAGKAQDISISAASGTAAGSMSAADKSKLDGVASGAQVNVLESVTGTAPIVVGTVSGKAQAVSINAATGATAGSMSATDKAKLDGYPASAVTQILGAVQVLTTAAATITFASIPQSAGHLRLYLAGRGDAAGAAVVVYMRFNADATASYDHQQVNVAGTTVAGYEALAQTSIPYVAVLPAASAPAGIASSTIIDIPNYARTTYQKTSHAVVADRRGITTGLFIGILSFGAWRNTAAITQITLTLSSGNFEVGTDAVLYGLREA